MFPGTQEDEMSKVVSANDLATGAVVFLDARGVWVQAVDAAAAFADREAAEVALLAASQSSVVDPFVVDRRDGQDGRAAMTLRNAIRAYGPTINYKPSTSSGSA